MSTKIPFIEYNNKEILNDWNKLITLSRDEILLIDKEWTDTYEKNVEIHNNNVNLKNEHLKNIINSLSESDIDVYKYKKKGFYKEKSGFVNWFKTNVEIPLNNKFGNFVKGKPSINKFSGEINGVNIVLSNNHRSLVSYYDNIVLNYNRSLKEINSNSKMLIECVRYATLHNLDINLLNDNEIINMVNEYASEQYLNEVAPVGSEVYLKHGCDYCCTYVVGEHRCSCGNRRVYLEVDGNIIDGFSFYLECY